MALLGSKTQFLFALIENTLLLERHRLSLWYFVGFICGILYYFSSLSHLNWFLIIGFSLCAFCVSCYVKMRNISSVLLSFLLYIFLFFALGLAIAHYRNCNLSKNIFINYPVIPSPRLNQTNGFESEAAQTYMKYVRKAESRKVRLDHLKMGLGIIVDFKGTVHSLKPIVRGISVILKDITINTESKHSQFNLHKIKISVPRKYMSNTSEGDIIELRAKLYPHESPILPYSYDPTMYAAFEQISSTGYAMSKLYIQKQEYHSITKFIQKLRTTIYQNLLKFLGGVNGNFAAAIILGETKGIEPKLLQAIRNTGLSHLLCVSGLHLSLVATIIFVTIRVILNLSNYMAFNFNIKLLSGIGALIGSYFYLLLTGSPIAATRAFIMTSIIIVSIILSRAQYSIRSVAIASGAILIINPEYVLYPSFQLSFMAVLSLIAGYELYQKNSWILGKTRGVFATIKLYFLSNIYSSFLASIVTMPLVISHFYTFPTYSIITNLLAIPIMSFAIMPLSIISIILLPVGLGEYFMYLMQYFIIMIINIVNYTNSLKGCVLYFGYVSSTSLLIFIFGFLWICIWETKLRLFGLCIMILGIVLMYNTKKPDFIFIPRLKLVAIKEQKDKFMIFAANNVGTFHKDMIYKWLGQEPSEVKPLIQSVFRTITNNVIRLQDLQNHGNTVMLFCNKDGCRSVLF